MRNSLLIILCCFGICLSFEAGAEGLPANPWAKKQNVTVGGNDKTNVASKTIDAAADMWSKVRNSKEFRQWKMPEQEKTTAENNQTSTDKEAIERKNLLTMLSNLKRVGYKMPDDYKNIVRKSPTRTNNASYEQMLRQWQSKYRSTKNNTMNIVNRSYNRMLSSIRRSTGIDINRTISDSVNAFK